ncbi:MAG: HEAT repeat domain-containing protein [Verrucomicrobia bacterium]|nr:HEAT repeat domain-containing protein [Verrucomicrobiota bacterium]
MSVPVELVNAASETWWSWVFHAAWQAALVGGISLAVIHIGRRWPGPLRYWLLVLALLKFACPPFLSVPSGVFSVAGPRPIARETASASNASFSPRDEAPIEAGPRVTATPAPIFTEMEIPKDPAISAPPSPAYSPPLPSAPALTGKTWLMLAHAAGALAFLGWLAWQVGRLSRATRRAQCLNEGELCEQFSRLAEQFGLRRRPRLMVSPEIHTPIAFGLLRPTVMLPDAVVENLRSSEVRVILAHELTHYRRGDLWVNWLQLLLLAAWWFHPIVWLVNRALRQVREDCCDDYLLARGLTSNDAYCDVLVRAASELSGKVPLGATLGFAERLHPLGRRVARIMDRTIRRWHRMSVVGIVVLLALGGLLLPGLRSREADSAAGSDREDRESALPKLMLALNSGEQAAASAESLEEQFAKLRWAGEDNEYFDEMQKRSQQMGPDAVPFLLSKLAKKPGQTDTGKVVDERRNAAMALGFIGTVTEQVVPKLIEALDDEAEVTFWVDLGRDLRMIRVSAVAADALGKVGLKAMRAVPRLIEAAKSGNARALVALARIAPESKEVLATLTGALHDHTGHGAPPLEGDYRQTSLDALGIAAKRNAAALPAVAACLDMDNSTFRRKAAGHLAKLSQDIPQARALVTEKLKTGTQRARVQLAAALVNEGSRSGEVFSILFEALRGHDGDLKQVALDGIGGFKKRVAEVGPVLREIIKNSTGKLRVKALHAYSQMGLREPEIVRAAMGDLRKCLTSPNWEDWEDWEVRFDGYSALTVLGEAAKDAEPILLELIRDPNPQTRETAARSLGWIKASPEKAIPALKEALNDPAPQVRSAALDGLAKYGEAAREFIPTMIDLLRGTNGWAAANALGDLGPIAEPAVPALVKAIQGSARASAIHALGRIGPAARLAVPALLTAANDPSSGVRLLAALGLWKIDGRTDAVGVLMDRLRSDKELDSVERRHAQFFRIRDIRWLGDIGPAAKAAIPILKEVANRDDATREAAEEALKRIQPEGKPQAASPF